LLIGIGEEQLIEHMDDPRGNQPRPDFGRGKWQPDDHAKPNRCLPDREDHHRGLLVTTGFDDGIPASVQQRGPKDGKEDADAQINNPAAPSRRSKATFASTPPAPEKPPSELAPNTRWQGIRIAIGLAPQAWPMAWAETESSCAKSP